ncbi:hypothetical protein BJ742DRAFT_781412 [Cladochytrium replicatum]|nr:hypothetical protein BJ742DRAFT_781412 [Cladochytrium replicatum]
MPPRIGDNDGDNSASESDDDPSNLQLPPQHQRIEHVALNSLVSNIASWFSGPDPTHPAPTPSSTSSDAGQSDGSNSTQLQQIHLHYHVYPDATPSPLPGNFPLIAPPTPLSDTAQPPGSQSLPPSNPLGTSSPVSSPVSSSYPRSIPKPRRIGADSQKEGNSNSTDAVSDSDGGGGAPEERKVGGAFAFWSQKEKKGGNAEVKSKVAPRPPVRNQSSVAGASSAMGPTPPGSPKLGATVPVAQRVRPVLSNMTLSTTPNINTDDRRQNPMNRSGVGDGARPPLTQILALLTIPYVLVAVADYIVRKCIPIIIHFLAGLAHRVRLLLAIYLLALRRSVIDPQLERLKNSFTRGTTAGFVLVVVMLVRMHAWGSGRGGDRQSATTTEEEERIALEAARKKRRRRAESAENDGFAGKHQSSEKPLPPQPASGQAFAVVKVESVHKTTVVGSSSIASQLDAPPTSTIAKVSKAAPLTSREAPRLPKKKSKGLEALLSDPPPRTSSLVDTDQLSSYMNRMESLQYKQQQQIPVPPPMRTHRAPSTLAKDLRLDTELSDDDYSRSRGGSVWRGSQAERDDGSRRKPKAPEILESRDIKLELTIPDMAPSSSEPASRTISPENMNMRSLSANSSPTAMFFGQNQRPSRKPSDPDNRRRMNATSGPSTPTVSFSSSNLAGLQQEALAASTLSPNSLYNDIVSELQYQSFTPARSFSESSVNSSGKFGTTTPSPARRPLPTTPVASRSASTSDANGISVSSATTAVVHLPGVNSTTTAINWSQTNLSQFPPTPEISRVSLTISTLQHLTHVLLENNELVYFPAAAVKEMKRLVVLNVSGNKLEHLPHNIGELVALKELWCAGNRLSVIPKDLGRCGQLEILDFNNNKLTQMPPNLFARMKKLAVLVLAHNQLRTLPPSIGLLRSTLVSLHVDNNPIDPNLMRLIAPLNTVNRTLLEHLERGTNSQHQQVQQTIRGRRSPNRITTIAARSSSPPGFYSVDDVSTPIMRRSPSNKNVRRMSMGSMDSPEDNDLVSSYSSSLTKIGAAWSGFEEMEGNWSGPRPGVGSRPSYVLPLAAAQIHLQRVLSFLRDLYDLDPRIKLETMESREVKVVKGKGNEEGEEDGTPAKGATREELEKEKKKKEKKQTPERRAAIANEILSTERTYVHLLTSLLELYVDPVEKGSADVGIPPQDSHLLFSNLRAIQTFHSRHFLMELEEAISKEGQPIGAVFVRYAPFLKMYSEYYNNFDTANTYVAQIDALASTSATDSLGVGSSPVVPVAASVLSSASISSAGGPRDSMNVGVSGPATATQAVMRNGRGAARKFRNYMRKVKKDARHASQINLQSFLILPVQRLPRYKLLIDELAGATAPSHPDAAMVAKATEEVARVVAECNEKKREWEEKEKGRELISLIRHNDESAGPVRKLQLAMVGRRLVRSFVARIVKVVEAGTSDVGLFGGVEAGNAELAQALVEDVGGHRLAWDVDSRKDGGVSITIQLLGEYLTLVRHTNMNSAVNWKKDRMSRASIGPLQEVRFIGKKDEDERSRETRLVREAESEAREAIQDERIAVPVSHMMMMSSSSASTSSSGAPMDGAAVYNVQRTTGREFKFFVYSDVVCWCKAKPEADGRYELLRVFAIATRPVVAPDEKGGMGPRQRVPAEAMEVNEEGAARPAGGRRGPAGVWVAGSTASIAGSISSSAGSISGSNGSVSGSDAIMRFGDDQCIVYVRGDSRDVSSWVDDINGCAGVAGGN